ncbi:alpha/beta hydrolase fold domain-containing protein [Novosphingobium terrae]|uniref:alpha/beta hydrolase fold domain-containing protein n=1 Tax=Novosphingobium terrae TaxID=2726189 RepID=UPI001981FD6D|nr:alpha/beta hydrolase fold domain-containing protein [Novosphingobium terrae]
MMASHQTARPDPMVQTFLDQQNEGLPPRLSALPGQPIAPEMVLFRPSGNDRAILPALAYHGLPACAPWTRHHALQALAERSGRLVFWNLAPDPSALSWVARHGPAFGADPDRLAVAADGVAAIGLIHEICARRQPPALAALLLATPVLGPAAPFAPQDAYLAQAHAAAVEQAEQRAAVHGWPLDLAQEQLRQLPPTLVLTAELDGFRDSAEGFARRLAAIDNDGAAMRCLGAIAHVTWLPPLLGAPVSLMAQQAMASFLQDIAG